MCYISNFMEVIRLPFRLGTGLIKARGQAFSLIADEVEAEVTITFQGQEMLLPGGSVSLRGQLYREDSGTFGLNSNQDRLRAAKDFIAQEDGELYGISGI